MMTARPQPPSSASSGLWAKIHERITWPIISSAFFSGIAFVAGSISINLDGCDNQSRVIVEAGEAALLRGDVDQADSIAAQALTVAPDCKCGHLLASKVKHWEMEMALKAGQTGTAQAHKLSCLAHVMHAGSSTGSGPELVAIRKACSVVAGDNG
jgi:hypothetical protein